MNRANTVKLQFMTITLLTVITSVGFSPEARADKGAAFLGGMIGGHVLTNMANRSERRTEAEEQMAYNSQPQAAAPAPAPAPASSGSSTQSVEDKLNTLDKLAAGGYISKEEYKKRKQAILDSM